MARSTTNQFEYWDGVFKHDFGYVTFSTDDTSVEITTTLSQINGVLALHPTGATSGAEQLYINETVGVGGVGVTGNAVTLQRVSEKVNYSHTFGIDDFASSDILECSLFSDARALTLLQAVMVNGPTAWTNSAVLNVGFSEDGTPDDYIDAQAITIAAFATTTFTTFASSAIAANAEVRCESAVADTTVASGTSLTLQCEIPLTSALKVWYHFIGVD